MGKQKVKVKVKVKKQGGQKSAKTLYKPKVHVIANINKPRKK